MVVYSLILACTLDGGIGYNNVIPWNIKNEMVLFSKITQEPDCYYKKNAIIMGRKTWESLFYKPLKNRINIIISSSAKKSITNEENVIFFNNFDDSLEYCDNNVNVNKVFVIGGKTLYDLCLNNEKYAQNIDCIHLSIIKKKYKCDTFINFKHIIKKYRNYNIFEILFDSDFIYIRLLKSN